MPNCIPILSDTCGASLASASLSVPVNLDNVLAHPMPEAHEGVTVAHVPQEQAAAAQHLQDNQRKQPVQDQISMGCNLTLFLRLCQRDHVGCLHIV